MPNAWVDPEVFLRYRGLTVYHVYDDDNYQSGTKEYWYSLVSYGSDDDNEGPDTGVFDVRNLPDEYIRGRDLGSADGRHWAIVDAIRGGHFDGWEHDEGPPLATAHPKLSKVEVGNLLRFTSEANVRYWFVRMLCALMGEGPEPDIESLRKLFYDDFFPMPYVPGGQDRK